MAKTQTAYERIEKELKKQNILDVTEVQGKCMADCDAAMIKLYRKCVDDLIRKEELEKELSKLNTKISKLDEKESAIAEDYLGRWSQLKKTSLSTTYKDNLKTVAQRRNKEAGTTSDSGSRTTWSEEKVMNALQGLLSQGDAKGVVTGAAAQKALNAPSIDVFSQRIQGRTGDIIALIEGKTSEPVIDAEHKVKKVKSKRAKYKVSLKRVLERLSN